MLKALNRAARVSHSPAPANKKLISTLKDLDGSQRLKIAVALKYLITFEVLIQSICFKNQIKQLLSVVVWALGGCVVSVTLSSRSAALIHEGDPRCFFACAGGQWL